MCNSFHICTLLDYWKAREDEAVLIECGNRITNRREEPAKRAGKLTQEQLAEQLDISVRTVINWENGHKHINNVGQLALLSEILECDIEYLTCQCDTLREENQNAVELYGLSEKALMKLQAYARAEFRIPFYEQVGLEYLDDLICDQHTFMLFLQLCNTYKYSIIPDRRFLDLYINGSDRQHIPAEYSLDNTELSIVREQSFIKALRNLFESDKKTITIVRKD